MWLVWRCAGRAPVLGRLPDEKQNLPGRKKNILPGLKIGFTDINEKFAMLFPEFDVVVSLTGIVSRWSLSCCINQFIIFIVISCNAGTKTHKRLLNNRDVQQIKINFLIPAKIFACFFVSFVLKRMFHCTSCTEMIALWDYISKYRGPSLLIDITNTMMGTKLVSLGPGSLVLNIEFTKLIYNDSSLCISKYIGWKGKHFCTRCTVKHWL